MRMDKMTVGFMVHIEVDRNAPLVEVNRLVVNIKTAATKAAGKASIRFSAPGKLKEA